MTRFKPSHFLLTILSVVAIALLLSATFSGMTYASGKISDSRTAASSDRSLNMILLANEMQLKKEFMKWYGHSGHEYGSLAPKSRLTLFNLFIKSSTEYQSQLSQIAKEQSTLQSAGAGISSVQQFKVSLGQKDPSIMFNIQSINLPWWLGGFTVGYDYFYYLQYSGINALYYYQGLESQLSQNNLYVSLSLGFGVGFGAAVIASVINAALASTIIGLILAAIATVLSYLLLSEEQQTLTNAYDSTQVFGNYGFLQVEFEQSYFLDGVSDAFEGYAWNYGTHSFQAIYGPVPEAPGANLLTSFDSMVQSGVNQYGSNNWNYVTQAVSPLPL